MLNMSGEKGSLTPGGKDIGKDDRDIDCELENSDAKLVQAAAGLEQYITLDHRLQRQDGVATNVEAHEAHAASRCPGRPSPEEQYKVDAPLSAAAEEYRRVRGR